MPEVWSDTTARAPQVLLPLLIPPERLTLQAEPEEHQGLAATAETAPVPVMAVQVAVVARQV